MRGKPGQAVACAAACLAVCLGSACGGAAASGNGASGRALDADARQHALDALGRRAFAALAGGDPRSLLASDAHLDVALTSDAAARIRMLRDRPLELPVARLREFRETRYVSVCAQGSEPAHQGGALGLRRPTWTLQRILVVGRRDGGQRLAAWVEADFAYGPEGFEALDLRRVEAPRWEHSDLEIATCDLRVDADSSD